MIQLHPDCLVFRTSEGELIPCSAETVTIELIGEASSILDPDTVREAAAAVVHYFKHELKRETVSVSEFSDALERALKCFGYEVSTQAGQLEGKEAGGAEASQQAKKPCGTDLRAVARAAVDFELGFFQGLRDEFQRQAQGAPEVFSFWGLRDCAKEIVGAKRWCQRCERFSDQVVGYLRECLSAEGGLANAGGSSSAAASAPRALYVR